MVKALDIKKVTNMAVVNIPQKRSQVTGRHLPNIQRQDTQRSLNADLSWLMAS